MSFPSFRRVEREREKGKRMGWKCIYINGKSGRLNFRENNGMSNAMRMRIHRELDIGYCRLVTFFLSSVAAIITLCQLCSPSHLPTSYALWVYKCPSATIHAMAPP
jgi:hypothetical protein